MRKYVMLAAAIGLAAPTQLVISSPAHAGYNNIPGFCKNYVGSGVDPETNRGECISLLTQQFHYVVDDKNANAYAQHACDYYQEADPDFFYGLWDTKQECMDEILTLP